MKCPAQAFPALPRLGRSVFLLMLEITDELKFFLFFQLTERTALVKNATRFGWRIVFFSGIPHPHLLGEPLPESPNFPYPQRPFSNSSALFKINHKLTESRGLSFVSARELNYSNE
jgi:hypothetical protein